MNQLPSPIPQPSQLWGEQLRALEQKATPVAGQAVCVYVCVCGGAVTLSSKNLGLSVLVGEPVSLSLLPPQDIQQNRNSHVVP